jgi:hypothetical protein
MDLEQLIAGLNTINAPDQGMNYQSSGIRRGDAKYDSQTGEPLRHASDRLS